MSGARGVALLWLSASLASCLPGDLRPEPAELYVAAEPSEAVLSGVVTEDGWTITFDRVVTAIGGVQLDGDPDGEEASCNDYSGTRYEWLIDFKQATREKVGLAYGLGRCSVEYRLRPPTDDTVLGAGTSSADFDLLYREGSDAFEQDRGTTLLVVGFGTDGVTSKRFSWAFRRSHELDQCEGDGDRAYSSVLELEGGQRVELVLELRAEELFRRASDDAFPLHFEAYASADANGDGDITLDELGGVPATPEQIELPPRELAGDVDPEDVPEIPETLADVVYDYLLPRVSRVAGGGACRAEQRNRR